MSDDFRGATGGGYTVERDRREGKEGMRGGRKKDLAGGGARSLNTALLVYSITCNSDGVMPY